MAKKKVSRRGGGTEELNITSMMDMMTIILVFLLKSYSTDDVSVAPSDDLQIPVSTSLKSPKLAVNVIVTATQIMVDGEPVLEMEEYTDESGRARSRVPASAMRGQNIPDLLERLEQKREKAEGIGQRVGDNEAGFQGEILLQAHKELPYEVIRSVMFTAGQAQFSQFRFVVIKGNG